MIYRILKAIVDFLSGTDTVRKNYERNNAGEHVWAADASKGIEYVGEQEIKYGPAWVTSQRAVILLTDYKIICGKWIIPLDQISTARLVQVNSLFGAAQILKIQALNGKSYQFGMQVNPEWTSQNVLPLILEKGQMQYSIFSVLMRLVIIAYFFYWVYIRFIR